MYVIQCIMRLSGYGIISVGPIIGIFKTEEEAKEYLLKKGLESSDEKGHLKGSINSQNNFNGTIIQRVIPPNEANMVPWVI